jgi:hypothetical protein
MGSCKACGHEYERHLFGGMCFYCDCKKAVYSTDEPVFLTRHEPETKRSKNGASPEEKKPRKARRLGNQ